MPLMKIAILTPTYSHFSGIDRLVEIEAEAHLKKGQQVDIFALSASMKPKNIGLIILGMPKSPFWERIYRLLMFLDYKKIRRYAHMLTKYDQIISHLYPMNILAYHAKKLNPKLTYTFYNAGVGITDTYSFAEQAYLRYFNHLTNRTIRNCDSAISISKFLARQLQKETGLRSEVRYIPTDTKRFNTKVNSKKIRDRYHIKSEPVFLYIGRISPHKGIHLLIESFKIVQITYPDAKLLIGGKHTFPKYSKKLKALSNKNIIFTGFINDNELPQFYAACDIYTTASLWEGFDIPIVEAFHTGKPSVAFDVGSHPEVLKKGILVKPKDTKAFADAILSLLKK